MSKKRAAMNLENIDKYDKCIDKHCSKQSDAYTDAKMSFLRMKKDIEQKLKSKKITSKEAKNKLYNKEMKYVKGREAKQFRNCQIKSCKSELNQMYQSKFDTIKYLPIIKPTHLLAYEIDKLKLYYKYPIQSKNQHPK